MVSEPTQRKRERTTEETMKGNALPIDRRFPLLMPAQSAPLPSRGWLEQKPASVQCLLYTFDTIEAGPAQPWEDRKEKLLNIWKNLWTSHQLGPA